MHNKRNKDMESLYYNYLSATIEYNKKVMSAYLSWGKEVAKMNEEVSKLYKLDYNMFNVNK